MIPFIVMITNVLQDILVQTCLCKQQNMIPTNGTQIEQNTFPQVKKTPLHPSDVTHLLKPLPNTTAVSA
jgi:hypothetical protein